MAWVVRNSESSSKNALEYQELLREWPFRTKSFFYTTFGVIPRFLIRGSCVAKALAIYRIEKPRNPENKSKIGKI